ncbi:MAG TPA: ABC transporter substrate-binding protein, partial [Bacteroidetes bacterium]|nr:ABC transporter substrate-binding protein [Bacteroidota bacterium]
MYKFARYLFTILLLTSCGKGLDQNASKSVFRMNLPDGLPTLDPAYASGQASIWMCGQLFDGLVQFDRDLNIQADLARSWEILDSGKTYLFHLREDVWFHSHAAFGQDSTRKFVAKDVQFSFERICTPAVAARGFWIFNGKIKGINAFREGSTKHISGFEVLNDSTFAIHLEQPFPPFLGTLAMAYAYVVPQEVTAKYGKDFRSHPVGTGPFRFKSWNEGASLILLRNARYFERDAEGKGLPYLDAVQVRFIREKLTEFREFLQGKLHFVNGLDKSTKDEIFLPDGSIK